MAEARARLRPAGEHDSRTPLERLCTLSTFTRAFNAAEFVSALSEEDLAAARAAPVLDARPLASTFAQAITRLQGIQQRVGDATTSLNSAVQVSQSVYTKKLRQLANNFDATQSSFDLLQARISEVGRTAMRIGEQLESLDRQRMRASETHDLIEYYYMFARGDSSRLDRLRKEGGRDGRLKAAAIARRLSVIAREVDIPGSVATREAIDRYCEQFERDMLRLFDKYYRRSDPKMMSHIAHVLQSFNGGVTCIQIYVNQHDFFISKDRVVEAERIGATPEWAALTDPNVPPPRTEPSLEALYTDIRHTVELEAQIIAAVFPAPLLVMQAFLQRVFAQSVQAYVETIMNRALALDTEQAGQPVADAAGLAFLRMLHVTRSATLALVADLKRLDLRSAGITTGSGPLSGLDSLFSMSGADADALTRTDASALLGHEAFSAAQLAAAGGSVLGAMLDQSVEELFFAYLDQVRYMDRECRVLSGLYAAALLHFFAYHRNTIKASRANATLFSRVREQFTGGGGSFGSSVAFATLADSTSGPQAPVSSFRRLVDRARGTAAVEEVEAADVEPADGELTLELAERLLHWHAEALGRCVDLGASNDIPKNTFALLRVLTEAFIKAYVEAAVETATVQLFGYDARLGAPPDYSVLALVERVEELVELWQYYVHTAVLPLTAPSVTLRRETAIYNNHNMLRVEGKCEALLQKLADNVLIYVSARLATQRRSDFLPKDDDVMFARLNTDPCLAIVEALEALEQAASTHLTERTRESLLREVGIGFHALLLEHLKKFTVSATGGLMLTKDLAMYQDVACRFRVPIVADRFEMLRQLGTLFIVQPSVLKSYMREGHLAGIDEMLLRPYLYRREDYTREVRTLPDEADSNGTASLLASLSQQTMGDASADTGQNVPEASRELSAFTTDVTNHAQMIHTLMHPDAGAEEAPQLGARVDGISTPRSATPPSLLQPSPRHSPQQGLSQPLLPPLDLS